MKPYAEYLGTAEKDGEEVHVLRAGDIVVALPIEEFVYRAVMAPREESSTRDTYADMVAAQHLNSIGISSRKSGEMLGTTGRTVLRWRKHLRELAL